MKELALQVGFGSEHAIDNIGCYWFYCNVSNELGRKWRSCTTELSHATVSERPKGLTLIAAPHKLLLLPPPRSRPHERSARHSGKYSKRPLRIGCNQAAG